MTRRRSRRRVALYLGGGLGGLAASGGAALVGLVFAETKLARRRIPIATDAPPRTDGTTWAAIGADRDRRPLRMAMLGDSTAAGYGAHRARDTPAAQLAIGISEAAGRPVRIANVAVVGAESIELPAQLTRLHGERPDLAVIMIGANDVTARTSPSQAVPYLADTVRALLGLGSEVVVCTCPDLGTIRPLSQPLRAYARRLSRKLARAQTVAVVEAGGRTVSLGDLLGPLFTTHLEYFADDRFHPSAAGYAEAARAVLPSALDALGLRTRARSAGPFTTRMAKPVTRAAAQAAAHPGSEVAPAERFGRESDHRGRFARLRRRLPRRSGPTPSPETAVGL